MRARAQAEAGSAECNLLMLAGSAGGLGAAAAGGAAARGRLHRAARRGVRSCQGHGRNPGRPVHGVPHSLAGAAPLLLLSCWRLTVWSSEPGCLTGIECQCMCVRRLRRVCLHGKMVIESVIILFYFLGMLLNSVARDFAQLRFCCWLLRIPLPWPHRVRHARWAQFARAMNRPQPREREYLAMQFTGVGLQLGPHVRCVWIGPTRSRVISR